MPLGNDSETTRQDGMAQEPHGYISEQTYQPTYQQLLWNRINTYLTEHLPEWPIITLDEVMAMRRRYFTAQGSENDRLSTQDILELQFGLRYRRTLQIHALLALYWNRRGFHSFANEHISKAFDLGSSSQ
ncbi:hypothetical protein MAJ_10074, partial [Metarhizium majus ARSEF 297]